MAANHPPHEALQPWADDVALRGPNMPKNDGHIKYLIEYLLTVYKRFGNTAVTNDLQWGAAALHTRDRQKDRIAELEALQSATQRSADYAAKNPLVGPARMFEAMAERIRAGEEYMLVLADYGLVHDAPQSETPAGGTAKVPEDYKALYMELLCAVCNTWPGKTRHQIALHYIQQAERGGDVACQAAAPSPDGNEEPK